MFCCALLISFVGQPIALIAAAWARLNGGAQTFIWPAPHIAGLVSIIVVAEMIFVAGAALALSSSTFDYATTNSFIPHLCSVARHMFAHSHS